MLSIVPPPFFVGLSWNNAILSISGLKPAKRPWASNRWAVVASGWL